MILLFVVLSLLESVAFSNSEFRKEVECQRGIWFATYGLESEEDVMALPEYYQSAIEKNDKEILEEARESLPKDVLDHIPEKLVPHFRRWAGTILVGPRVLHDLNGTYNDRDFIAVSDEGDAFLGQYPHPVKLEKGTNVRNWMKLQLEQGSKPQFFNTWHYFDDDENKVYVEKEEITVGETARYADKYVVVSVQRTADKKVRAAVHYKLAVDIEIVRAMLAAKETSLGAVQNILKACKSLQEASPHPTLNRALQDLKTALDKP